MVLMNAYFISITYPVAIHLFKASNGNIKKMREICLKLTTMGAEQRH